jgi:transcriptional pleiotropic regulator of transition state genes
MRDLGIVRKVDQLGRISLPIMLRKLYNLKINDTIEMYQEGDSVIIKKYLPRCIFCGGTEKVETHKDKLICQECTENLSRQCK